MNRAACLLLAMGLMSFSVAPGAATPGLAASVQAARSSDPAWAAAVAGHEAALEQLPQARAGLLPQAAASATWGRADVDFGLGPARYDVTNLGVSLTQPLFRGQNLVQLSQAHHAVARAGDALDASANELTLRTARAWLGYALAGDNLANTRAQKAAIDQELARTRRAFEVGSLTITDFNEAQARFDLIVAREIADVDALALARREFEQVTGVEAPDPPAVIRDFQLPALEPATLEDWLAAARQGSAELLAQHETTAIAGLEVRRAAAGHLPTVDLVAAWADQDQFYPLLPPGRTLGVEWTQVGLAVTLPLFAGGYTQSRLREARAGERRARGQLADAERRVDYAVQQAWLGVEGGRARVRALEQARRSSELALESTRLAAQLGLRTGIDVLNAEQQSSQVRRDLLAARFGVLFDSLRLVATARTITDADVLRLDRLVAASGP